MVQKMSLFILKGKGIGTVSGYVTQSVTTYLLGIDAATWNEQYSATYTGLSSKYTTLDFTKEDENAYQKYMIFAPREYTITDSVDLLNPTRTDYIFLGWYNNSEFNGNNLTTIEEGSYGNVTLYAKWIHVVDNAKNLALAALDEYIKSDEIVNGSHYEINKVELEEEIETQKGLISAALSIESVNTALENAKKALLAIAAPIAPTAIHLNAASNTPLVGASLALQLSFEGPEGYQKLADYVSSNKSSKDSICASGLSTSSSSCGLYGLKVLHSPLSIGSISLWSALSAATILRWVFWL